MKFLQFFTRFGTRILLIALLSCMVLVSVLNFNKNYNIKINSLKNTDFKKTVTCKIVSFPVYENGKFKFTGSITQNEYQNILHLKMNVIIKCDTEPIFKPGDVIMLSDVKFISPSPKDNEGGFDFMEYSKSKNIHGNLYTEKDAVIIKQGKNLALRKMSDMRNNFMKNADMFLKPRISGIAKALITGERYDINDIDSYNLRASGVYHIVAISGLHLNIFIMFVSVFISRLKIRRTQKLILSSFLSFVTALFVLIFTGFGLSVIRAFSMLLISMGSAIFERKYSGKNALFISTAIILIIAPSSAFSVGYNLSVLSTYAVLKSADIIKYMKTKPKLKTVASFNIVSVIVTSILCSLYTLPVMIDSFGFLSVYSWIANFFILPLATPALAMCVLFGIVSIFKISILTKFISYPVTALISAILKITEYVANLPFATVNLYPKYTVCIALLTIALCMCIFLIIKNKFKHCVIFSLIFAVAMGSVLVYNKNDDAKIIFADVGQGDCSIVLLPNDEAYMIDFGSTFYNENIYNEIKNTLIKLDIKYLNAAFVSHFHMDHMSGISDLVNDGYVKKLILPKFFDRQDKEIRENLNSLFEASLRTNTDICYMEFSSKLETKIGAVFEVLSPCNTMFFEHNDMSAVIKFCYGNVSFLFTGDISDDCINLICDKNMDCDVLKVPHHGGKTNYIDTLIYNTTPKYSVISCAQNNIYGHPHKDTIKALENAGSYIYRTDKTGAVTFVFDKNKIKSVDK